MELLEGMIEGPVVDGRILPRLADGQAPRYLYRIMSIDEYEQAREVGHLSSREGRIHADIEPHFEYAEPGDNNVLVKIAYRDEDGWRTKWTSLGCIAITDSVPIDRVTEVSRGSRSKLELRESAPAINGFWVTDKGEFLYNDWDNDVHHHKVAADHFKMDGEDGFLHAMKLGWIRVLAIADMELNAQWEVANRKALRALRSFVRQCGDEFPTFFIEGMPKPEDPEVGIDKRSFLEILDTHINKSVNESVETIDAWSGARLRVHHNPPLAAFQNIIQQNDVLRGILSDDGEDVWLWNAHQAVHSNVSQELGIPASYPCIFYNRGRWDGPVMGRDGEYAPALARLTPELVAARKARQRRETDDLIAQLMADDEFGLLAEAEHTEPSWRYDQGGGSVGFGGMVVARTVSGNFKINDEKAFDGSWPYGYSFVFARNGEVEVSFYLDVANYFGRDLAVAVEKGRVSPEDAKELKFRQLSDGMGIYNMMGQDVARSVLRVMGQLIQRFIAEYDPPILVMVAKTDRRRSIYERLLKRLPGYAISVEPDPRGNGHLVYARKDTDSQMISESFTTKDGRPIKIWHEEHDEDNEEGALIIYDPNWDVYAEVDGKVVGSGWFTDDHFSGIQVSEAYRRMGIATALYDYVESLGCYVRPSPNGQEPDGAAFWDARKPDRRW